MLRYPALGILCFLALIPATFAQAPGSAPSVEPPVLETFAPAEYPPAAAAAGIEGVVGLVISIDAAGRVVEVSIQESAGFGFDEAAEEAARQFVFRPAKKNGNPVPSQIFYRYRFSLRPPKAVSPLAVPLDPGDGRPPPGALGEVSEDLAQPGSVQGQLYERGTRQKITDAQIFSIAQDGAILEEVSPDDTGSFSLSRVPAGGFSLKVIAPGYEPLQYSDTIKPGETIELTLRLTPLAEGEYGLVVRGEKDEPEVTKRSLSKEEIGYSAGSQGDVIRALTNMPGIARPPASSGLLIVRGSAPEDTRAHLGGLFVPHLYHLTGFTSVLNPEMVERLEFLPGAYSARYGRVNGGIIDAIPATGAPDYITGAVDIDIFDAGAVLRGPIGEKGSFAIGARRSYIDSLLPVVLDEVLPLFDVDASRISLTTAPRSWDYEAIYEHKLDQNSRLRFLGLGAGDSVSLIVDDANFDPSIQGAVEGNARFYMLSASYEKLGDFKRSATLGVVFAEADGSLGPEIRGGYTQTMFQGRYLEERPIHDTFSLAFGGDFLSSIYKAEGRSFLPPVEGGFTPPVGSSDIFELEMDDEWIEGGIFLEAKKKWEPLTLVPGLRLDRMGGSSTLLLQPRLFASYDLAVGAQLRASAGFYSQDPLPFELDEAFGDPALLPEQSFQVALGGVKRFSRWELDITGFYKRLWNIVTRQGSGTDIAELTTNDAEGWVYGAEVLLRIPPGRRLTGWLAYTFTRSLRKDGEGFQVRPFDFDQPHVFTALATYKIDGRWTISGRWRYASGNPNTPVSGAVFDADADLYIPLPGLSNSERHPPFHQLDIRADREFRFERWMLSVYVEIFNAYNRANPEADVHNFDYTQSGFFTGLPILPSFGVAGRF